MNLQIGLERACILKHGERRTAFGGAAVAHGQNMRGDPVAIELDGAACRSKRGQQIAVAALTQLQKRPKAATAAR